MDPTNFYPQQHVSNLRKPLAPTEVNDRHADDDHSRSVTPKPSKNQTGNQSGNQSGNQTGKVISPRRKNASVTAAAEVALSKVKRRRTEVDGDDVTDEETPMQMEAEVIQLPFTTPSVASFQVHLEELLRSLDSSGNGAMAHVLTVFRLHAITQDRLMEIRQRLVQVAGLIDMSEFRAEECMTITDESLEWILSVFPEVVRLHIPVALCVKDPASYCIFRGLKKLHIAGCTTIGTAPASMKTFVHHMGSCLEELYLSGCENFASELLSTIHQEAVDFRCLSRLEMLRCNITSTQAFAFRRMPAMKRLLVSGKEFGDIGGVFIARMSALEHLKVTSPVFGDAGVAAVCSGCSRLTYLELISSSIGRLGIECLGMLSQCLQSLKLVRCNRVQQDFMKALPRMARLESFHASECDNMLEENVAAVFAATRKENVSDGPRSTLSRITVVSRTSQRCLQDSAQLSKLFQQDSPACTEVELQRHDAVDNEFVDNLARFASSTRMTTLVLSHSDNIQNVSINIIASKMKNLTTLKLAGCSKLSHFCLQDLSTLVGLEVLDLSMTWKEGTQELKALKNLRNLKTLFLRQMAAFTDEVLTAIAPNLGRLELADFALTGVTAPVLFKSVNQFFPNMRILFAQGLTNFENVPAALSPVHHRVMEQLDLSCSHLPVNVFLQLLEHFPCLTKVDISRVTDIPARVFYQMPLRRLRIVMAYDCGYSEQEFGAEIASNKLMVRTH